MIPKYGRLLVGLLTVCGAAAQHPDDEYYPYAARQEERTPLLLTDSPLFYRAVQTTPDRLQPALCLRETPGPELPRRIRLGRGCTAFVSVFRGDAPVGGR